jgi:hypothetical protein
MIKDGLFPPVAKDGSRRKRQVVNSENLRRSNYGGKSRKGNKYYHIEVSKCGL